ncbi:hypothetical protein [Salinibacterium sp. SWN1162]|uniref:DUF6994 family protein n=1 Tax=Salinibacterium sp. SWN1162 TaxID=2792053 RepID=UPI0018CE6A75|nr:hypothetical protein [Salinibacterium sp. SWN1162]MBH0009625.1 hypothetical protein [Salinibacterium sp. SWN1162]
MQPPKQEPVDVSYDYRKDSTGEAPHADASSPSLKAAHRALWNKELPTKKLLSLNASGPDYLNATIDGLEFALASDAIATSHPGRAEEVRNDVGPDVIEDFVRHGGTIGGRMVWPLRRIHKPTVNQARGTRVTISDRIDLTLEALKLWYTDSNAETPLTDVFNDYADWFAQFGVGKEGWEGFIDFFLLQDILDGSGSVRMFANTTPTLIPTDAVEFAKYLEAQLSFVRARNQRIFDWCIDNDVPVVGGKAS